MNHDRVRVQVEGRSDAAHGSIERGVDDGSRRERVSGRDELQEVVKLQLERVVES